MSKMGVSTVASYTGAQIFEAIGLGERDHQHLLHRDHVPAGRRRLRRAGRRGGGAGTPGRSRPAAPRPDHRRLETGGDYQWRREGEPHLFSPETVFKLQHATRSRRYEIFKEYTRLVDDQSARLMTLRGLLRIRGVDDPTDPRGLGAASLPARAPHRPAWSQGGLHPTGPHPVGKPRAAAAPSGGGVRGSCPPGTGRPARPRAARSPSTRSSRSRPSCAGSPPARCPTAPSRPRRTRPWPSR